MFSFSIFTTHIPYLIVGALYALCYFIGLFGGATQEAKTNNSSDIKIINVQNSNIALNNSSKRNCYNYASFFTTEKEGEQTSIDFSLAKSEQKQSYYEKASLNSGFKLALYSRPPPSLL